MHDICIVSAEEVIAVRWLVLRPGFPRESAIFAGDADVETRHFGAYVGGQIIAVASIYSAELYEQPQATAWQLRGMATLDSARGQGHGAALLVATEDYARRRGAVLIWCNARVTAAEFYRHHGWQILGEVFDIPSVGPHYKMLRYFATA